METFKMLGKLLPPLEHPRSSCQKPSVKIHSFVVVFRLIVGHSTHSQAPISIPSGFMNTPWRGSINQYKYIESTDAPGTSKSSSLEEALKCHLLVWCSIMHIWSRSKRKRNSMNFLRLHKCNKYYYLHIPQIDIINMI